MTKELKLNIPDEDYDKIASLSNYYKIGINEVAEKIVQEVCSHNIDLTNLSETFKVPPDLVMTLGHFLNSAREGISLFDDIEERLGVKGMFGFDSIDFDLSKDFFCFNYSALMGSNLYIESFYFTLDKGIPALATNTAIFCDKERKEALDRLKTTFKNRANIEPPEFGDLETYDISLEEETEDMWSIDIECVGESIEDLPTLKQISRIIKRIFKKAGIKREA
jgi:hypothetical protein